MAVWEREWQVLPHLSLVLTEAEWLHAGAGQASKRGRVKFLNWREDKGVVLQTLSREQM